MQNDIPLTEQVLEALSAFYAASINAESAAAAYGELKRLVGANESERKERKQSTPAEDYAGYVLHLADAETQYKAAAAHLERVEKQLNVLRELLNHETAEIDRETARLTTAAAATAAQQRNTPIVPVKIGAGICPDCRQPYALDVHDDCVPF